MSFTVETEHTRRYLRKIGAIAGIVLMMGAVGMICNGNVNGGLNNLNFRFEQAFGDGSASRLMHGFFRETENRDVCWQLEQRGNEFHLVGQTSLSEQVCQTVVGRLESTDGDLGSGTLTVTSPAGEKSLWNFVVEGKMLGLKHGKSMHTEEFVKVDNCNLAEKMVQVSVDEHAKMDTGVVVTHHMDKLLTGKWFAINDGAQQSRQVKKVGYNVYEMASTSSFVKVFVKKMRYRYTSSVKNSGGEYEGVVTFVFRGGRKADLKFVVDDNLAFGMIRLSNLDGSLVKFDYSRVQ